MSVTYKELPKNRTEEAVAVLAGALMVEPGFAHIIPDDTLRHETLQTVIASMLSTARRKGAIWSAMEGDSVLGAAVGLKPGNFPLSFLEQLRAIPYSMQLRRLDKDTVSTLREFDTNGKNNFPAEPCWYIQAVGVSPASQGKGVGSGLMQYMLAEIGAEACYLETATKSNIPFYQKAGFDVHNPAAVLVPNGGPSYCTFIHRP